MSQTESGARAELIELMCLADPGETVPLSKIKAMAEMIVRAGYRVPVADDETERDDGDG